MSRARTFFFVFALVLVAAAAHAQGTPGLNGGNVVTVLQPDNGGPAASPLRSLMGPDLVTLRRWAIDLAAQFQLRPAARPATRVRRATMGRGIAGAP